MIPPVDHNDARFEISLYSEFGRFATAVRRLGDKCWLGFLLAASIVTTLSYIGNCASVMLYVTEGAPYRPSDVSQVHKELTFGFMTELNAGVTYLVLVPMFLLLCFRFVSNMQAALRNLASRDCLVLNIEFEGSLFSRIFERSIAPLARWRTFRWLLALEQTSPRVCVAAEIAESNRRALPPLLLIATALIVFSVIVFTEYNPWNGGDHRTLAFGYIQADHFATDHWDVTISDFEKKNNRRVRDIQYATDNGKVQGINAETAKSWYVHWISGGPVGLLQLIAFWVFAISQVTLMCCFTVIACWFVFKALFIGWRLHSALQRRGPLLLNLDLGDKEKRCGCSVLDRPWTQMILCLSILSLIDYCSFTANALKGSMRVPGIDAPAFVLAGQGTVHYAPIVLLLLLVAYCLWLYVFVDSRLRDIMGRAGPDIALVPNQQLFAAEKVMAAILPLCSSALLPLLPSGFHSGVQRFLESIIKIN
jgi:hypothetical protein